MTVYSASFNAVAVTAQQDFFEVNAPADAVVLIHAVEFEQATEVGDAAEEMLNMLFKRATSTTTSGTGGTTPTPTPVGAGEVAFGGTVEVNNTTKALVNTGAFSTIRPANWNIRVPYLWLPTPEQRTVIPPSNRFIVELLTTPADSITIAGTVWFEEIG